ncbi:MAG TPA: VTT domain-containing protein [Terracidiphilus sp.]|nr:VTT domain-containing protein [Terracidiphilus sp.]
MRFLRPFLQLIFHLGYFGPLVMGALDSSFLILPFGNDLVVVGLVAQHRQGAAWYVVMAAIGSTIGASLLAVVARKLGEEGISRFAGKRRFESVKKRMGNHAGIAIAISGLAPPPFPFTTVIGGTAALGYPVWRILVINFCARLLRFTLLALLALHFGKQVLRVAQSAPFEWSMAVFIALCAIASGFSIAHLMRKPHPQTA